MIYNALRSRTPPLPPVRRLTEVSSLIPESSSAPKNNSEESGEIIGYSAADGAIQDHYYLKIKLPSNEVISSKYPLPKHYYHEGTIVKFERERSNKLGLWPTYVATYIEGPKRVRGKILSGFLGNYPHEKSGCLEIVYFKNRYPITIYSGDRMPLDEFPEGAEVNFVTKEVGEGELMAIDIKLSVLINPLYD